MKRLGLLLMAIVSITIISCKKDRISADAAQQKLLVGKWSLQTQNITEYIDDVKQPDLALVASNKIESDVQFNNDGTFAAVTQYNSNGIGSTLPSSVVSVDKVNGTYSFYNSNFNLSAVSLGSLRVPDFSGTTGTTTSYQLNSQSVKMEDLTLTYFNLHTEYVATEINGGKANVYKITEDSHYTR